MEGPATDSLRKKYLITQYLFKIAVNLVLDPLPLRLFEAFLCIIIDYK